MSGEPEPAVPPVDARPPPRVGAVLLAAGLSRRFGARNKLLAPVGGTALVGRPASALDGSRAAPIVAVVGHEADAVAAELARISARIEVVRNPDYLRGMGNSVAMGVRRLMERALETGVPLDGVMIVPGDLPGLTAADVEAVIAAFARAGGEAIVHGATAGGAQRHPVVWPRRFLADLAALSGEPGGKTLMEAERLRDAGAVVAVALSERALADVDAPGDLAASGEERGGGEPEQGRGEGDD